MAVTGTPNGETGETRKKETRRSDAGPETKPESEAGEKGSRACGRDVVYFVPTEPRPVATWPSWRLARWGLAALVRRSAT